MSRNSHALPPSPDVARYLAEKGEAVVEQMQATVELARAMLAGGEVLPPTGGVDPHRPPYPWETTERRSHALRRVWQGVVGDFATGEGSTSYFAVALANGEDEFRRYLSHEFGRELANQAQVHEGVGGFLPMAPFFLSHTFRATLGAFDRGENRPVAMSFVARYHTNYS